MKYNVLGIKSYFYISSPLTSQLILNFSLYYIIIHSLHLQTNRVSEKQKHGLEHSFARIVRLNETLHTPPQGL